MADDEEPVCPKPRIEKECHPACEGFWTEYKACAARIAKKGHGQCEPQNMDYWRCIDRCTAPKLFAELK
eukprot:CAMPEP_0203815168 /NCGR_PEP_ID=MMETSP0115-20131106/8095_1 /ASSEMBLY_ACC=CAM_ASM_000227 /TAXON_ID=33651 /ORGANISM="Bicosoecid sp, Strain ms1" /LENGTH=68 /DNA_ID=CAMNT_0050724061 /DNA_START=20 /DNA_END=226 /DNA_ORIENTATION=+